MLAVEAAAALVVAALVEVLLVEVAPFWEGVVSMDLDSLVVLEVVLHLVVLSGWSSGWSSRRFPSGWSSVIRIVGIIGVTKRRLMMVFPVVI